LEAGAEGGSVVFDGAAGVLVEEHMAGEIGHGQLERILLDGNVQLGGGESHGGFAALLRDCCAGSAGRSQHGPRRVFGQFASRANAHPHYVIAQGGNPHYGGAGANFDAIFDSPGSGNPVQPDEACVLPSFGGGIRLGCCGYVQKTKYNNQKPYCLLHSAPLGGPFVLFLKE